MDVDRGGLEAVAWWGRSVVAVAGTRAQLVASRSAYMVRPCALGSSTTSRYLHAGKFGGKTPAARSSTRSATVPEELVSSTCSRIQRFRHPLCTVGPSNGSLLTRLDGRRKRRIEGAVHGGADEEEPPPPPHRDSPAGCSGRRRGAVAGSIAAAVGGGGGVGRRRTRRR